MATGVTVRHLRSVLSTRRSMVVEAARRFQSFSTAQTRNAAYPLYPSVSQLLHENGIPESEIPQIPASGPKGRLLKGDVLAYLGTIPSDYPATQAARFDRLSQLDLSNIKLQKPAAPQIPQAATAPPPPMVSVAISVSLAAVLSVQNKIKDTFGVTIPLSTFLARATDIANDDLPRQQGAQPSPDELFDEILGLEPVTTSRGDYVPELNAVDGLHVSSAAAPGSNDVDVIDFLTRNAVNVRAASSVSSAHPSDWSPEPGSGANNIFSLTVPESEERRARTFLERVKVLLQIEPGRLVL